MYIHKKITIAEYNTLYSDYSYRQKKKNEEFKKAKHEELKKAKEKIKVAQRSSTITNWTQRIIKIKVIDTIIFLKGLGYKFREISEITGIPSGTLFVIFQDMKLMLEQEEKLKKTSIIINTRAYTKTKQRYEHYTKSESLF
jgi:sRNA-binding protein